jgi:hypothetical protein
VTDGSDRLVAMADSSGGLNSIYAQSIPGSNGGPWASGITVRGQTFDPIHWGTPQPGDTMSTFQTRQYDPGTGQ